MIQKEPGWAQIAPMASKSEVVLLGSCNHIFTLGESIIDWNSYEQMHKWKTVTRAGEWQSPERQILQGIMNSLSSTKIRGHAEGPQKSNGAWGGEKKSPSKYCLWEGLGLDSAESNFKDTSLSTLKEMRKAGLNEVWQPFCKHLKIH